MEKTYPKFYTGGLAELVDHPSETTLHLFNRWFTGKASLGHAMKELELPYNKIDTPLFRIDNNRLSIDAGNEERTLYSNTLLKYISLEDNRPHLGLNFAEILKWRSITNTFKIIKFQTKIINSEENTLALAKNLLNKTDVKTRYNTAKVAINYIEKNVWPYVIAIGYINDFYSSYLEQKLKTNYLTALQKINPYLIEEDWLFRANFARQNWQDYKKFIEEFGIMADDPYEITCPRWHETTSKIKPNKKTKKGHKKHIKLKLTKEEELLKNLMVIRSESKRRALIHIDKLRQLYGLVHLKRKSLIKLNKKIAVEQTLSGTGKPCSIGTAIGMPMFVTSPDQIIPKGSIGIFPNAGPLLSHKYAECNGMIFLSGGLMSHGSILARELQIPAIIDQKAEGIPLGIEIKLDGNTGTWKAS